jgi:hypothetical protein
LFQHSNWGKAPKFNIHNVTIDTLI